MARPSIIAALLSVTLLCCWPLAAQVAQSSIVGTCTDPSGAAVPGVNIIARSVNTNQRFEAVSNLTGNFVLPSLPIGEYEVTAASSGFKTGVRTGLQLQVGDRARVDFTLQIGVAEQKVEIVGEAPLVQTDSSGLGQVIENLRISQLPLNGRSALALSLLTPGVRNLQGGYNVGFGRSANFQLANIGINGSPNGFNAFLLDGGLNTSIEFGEVAVAPMVESVAEFKVLTNFLPPEFGLTGGGVINTVSKSGTNEFHGSVYEFLRNEKLDARKTFAAVRSPFRYNQFGMAAGGPVWIPKVYRGSDRTFFFFNYEGSRYRSSVNPITSVPSEEKRRGDFSRLFDAGGRLIPIFDPATTRLNAAGSGYVRDAFAGNVIPQNRFDRVAAKVIPMLPLPNRPSSNPYTDSLNFLSLQANPTDVDQYHARLDHNIGSANHLFGRWSTNRERAINPGDAPPWPNRIWYERVGRNRYQQATLSDVHTFAPTLLNELRITFVRQAFPFTPPTYNQGWPQQIGLPASVPPTLFPILAVAGLPNMGNANTFGLRYFTAYQLFDMVTKIRGNHTLKFGFEFRLQRESNFQVSAPSGSFSFPQGLTGNPQSQTGTGSGLATFLLGQAGSGSLQVMSSATNVGHVYSGFAGDDWKVSRRLSLNLGLRYDFQAPPTERRGQSSNFNPLAPNPQNKNLQGRFEFARIDYGDTIVRPDRNNFGPRVGFAFDVSGNAKTVLRGGYALLYSPTFSSGFFPSTAGFSVTSQYQPPGNNSNLAAFQLQDGPPFIDQPLGAKMGPSAFLGSSVNWEEAVKRTTYTQQWNFGVQKQLPGRWLIEVSYAGNRGLKLLSDSWQYNDLDPQYLSLGLGLQNPAPNPLAGQIPGSLGNATVTRRQTLLPLPQYSGVSVLNPLSGSSTYHALQSRVEHRFATGLTLLASYTNAKLISDSERNLNNWSGVQTGGTGYQSGKFNRRVERSIDPTDVAQRLVVSSVYELPAGSGRRLSINNHVLDAVAGGWSASGVFTRQGGQPLLVRGASNFLANRPNSTGQSARLNNRTRDRWFDTSAFVNPPNFTFGNVGRTLPDVRGPGLMNVDLALLKTQKLREKLRLQFRAEAFNIANLTNLGQPNVSFSPGADGRNASATFGSISSSHDARSLQFGLKLLW